MSAGASKVSVVATDTVRITLAGAPMGKERVRRNRQQQHAYTPERTVNYESRLALAAQEVMAGRPLFEGPLRVTVTVGMPVAESKPKKWKAAALAGEIRPVKKPDWDNFGKILDAMNLVVWVDDSQIVDGTVRKYYSATPGLTVVVEKINLTDGVFG